MLSALLVKTAHANTGEKRNQKQQQQSVLLAVFVTVLPCQHGLLLYHAASHLISRVFLVEIARVNQATPGQAGLLVMTSQRPKLNAAEAVPLTQMPCFLTISLQ